METIQQQPITRNMTIGELVQLYPSVVEILLDEGVHCVGCGASYFETVEQGLSGHGKTAEEIDDVVKRMNEAIPKEEGDVQTLLVTENAAQKLKQILAEEAPGSALRVRILKGGCSGYQYEFSIDNEITKDDKIFDILGVKFVVDAESFSKMRGSRIDYIDALTGAGFKVSNPNAEHTCGCGQSFS